MKTKNLTTKTSSILSNLKSTCQRGLLGLSMAVICFSSCKKDDDDNPIVSPKGPKPAWAPNIEPEMQAVIEKYESYGVPPLETLSPVEARKQPSVANAVKDLMRENGIAMPAANVDTAGRNIPVQGGMIHLRMYTPASSSNSMPVIVYYHGGGWVIANTDTYDASIRGLASMTGAIVVSVDYRQAPEFKFPTAHNDSYAAYQWVLANAASFKGNPDKVAVAGESAGGNLAAAVSMMARDNRIKVPVHQLLVYPIANYNFDTQSYNEYANAKPLSKPLMQWFFDKYLRTPADGANPWISLVNANLSGLPSSTVILAQIDPLRTEGEMLSDKLKAAGVPVMQRTYSGVTHEFFGMAAVLPEAKDAQGMAASELKKAFEK
ncbi:alpha/beta hydrolase [Desertivirga brevis]|uniref:alpha/beta hydrolase n=1 Tax=Desertivirga brevis TaxID=2810310 RepID=UPI001A97856A|nr:alpha/beta hydrolase [Pedobacter sp. SYSU D00873]